MQYRNAIKNISLLVLLLFPLITKAEKTFEKEEVIAQKILTRLYNSYGNFIYPVPPTVKIVNEKKRVAAFVPDGTTGKIILEKTTFDLCQQFGPDAESALAFILGHELGHFFERGHNKAFANDYLKWPQSIQKEKGADIWGVFCAYLAGYKTVAIVPELLEAVYEEYGLLGKKLYGYPSFEERQQIAQEVTLKVKELIHVFDAANYLTAIGEYDLAASSYLYIEQYYQGREIYNNLGVNYALHAMNFTNINTEPYLYPLEIDMESRIKKPQVSRGEKLTEKEKQYRTELLKKAKSFLEIAGKIDYNYFSDDINVMAVLTLLLEDCIDCESPLDYYKYHELAKLPSIIATTKTQKANLRLVLAIAKMKLGETDAAKRIWTSLIDHSNKQVAYQAKYNLGIASKKNNIKTTNEGICPTVDLTIPKDDIRLHRVSYDNGFLINTELDQSLEIRHTANTDLYLYKRADGSHFSLQKSNKTQGSILLALAEEPYEIVSTTKGGFIICKKTKSIWLVDADGLVVEGARFYEKSTL